MKTEPTFDATGDAPKYEAFSKFLLRQIQSGVFPPGSKLPAERDLARRYDIAHMTVNKALNGLVSAGYLERMPPRGTFVREIAPLRNAVAVMDYRALHALLPQPLQHAMADAGFVLTVFDIYQVVKSADLFLNFCTQMNPELLLIEGYSILPFELFDRIPTKVPRIVFHRNEHEVQSDIRYVLCDFEEDGRLAARMLLEAGKSRIGVFLGVPDTPLHTDYAFLRGVRSELALHGLEPVLCWESHEQTEKAIARMVRDDTVDGICAIIDSYLVPVVKELRHQGKSAPENIALIGHNNTPWADSYDLTSMDIRPWELTKMVCRAIAAPANDYCVKLPGTPVFRQSCPGILHQQAMNM